MKRPFERVAVLKGGPSAERDVSLNSGAAVARGLREAGYDVCEVDVAGRDVVLPEGIEAVFIALHGEFGEDGGVQAILDGMGVPYTGSGVVGSRKALDKVLTKRAFDEHGIPSATYQVMRQGEVRELPLPVVIKPANQGSSIGVHRVFAEEEWDAAVADAFSYDSTLLVEAFIPGRELTVGVVERTPLPLVEIVAPEGWYGYDAKYTKGRTEYIVPAEVDEETVAEAQRIALEVFDALECEGVGRVDFRMGDDGSLVVLELNTIPGFTETSLLPKAAGAAGMTFSELCDRIMRTARTNTVESGR
jgi:D-alanine-D-alanine ligase